MVHSVHLHSSRKGTLETFGSHGVYVWVTTMARERWVNCCFNVFLGVMCSRNLEFGIRITLSLERESEEFGIWNLGVEWDELC